MTTVFVKEPIQLFPTRVRVFLPNPPKVIEEGKTPLEEKPSFVDQIIYLKAGEKLTSKQTADLTKWAKEEYEKSTRHKTALPVSQH